MSEFITIQSTSIGLVCVRRAAINAITVDHPSRRVRVFATDCCSWVIDCSTADEVAEWVDRLTRDNRVESLGDKP